MQFLFDTSDCTPWNFPAICLYSIPEMVKTISISTQQQQEASIAIIFTYYYGQNISSTVLFIWSNTHVTVAYNYIDKVTLPIHQWCTWSWHQCTQCSYFNLRLVAVQNKPFSLWCNCNLLVCATAWMPFSIGLVPDF